MENGPFEDDFPIKKVIFQQSLCWFTRGEIFPCVSSRSVGHQTCGAASRIDWGKVPRCNGNHPWPLATGNELLCVGGHLPALQFWGKKNIGEFLDWDPRISRHQTSDNSRGIFRWVVSNIVGNVLCLFDIIFSDGLKCGCVCLKKYWLCNEVYALMFQFLFGTQLQIPSGKLTWQWKMSLLKMYSLLKMGIFPLLC